MLDRIGFIEAFEYGPKYRQRRGEVVSGAWAVIEFIGDGIQFVLRVHGQIRALGQVLAQQPVGILA